MFDRISFKSDRRLGFSLSQVEFRHADKNDLPALEWDGEYTHYRKLYEDVYRSAQSGRAVLWVADYPGVGLIGQLFVQLDSQRTELADGKDCAYIYGFRVKPKFRRHGIGTRLIEIAEADISTRGYTKIILNVNRDNDDARRLYIKHGFRVVAAEPGRWSYVDHLGHLREVHEPSWRMEKNI